MLLDKIRMSLRIDDITLDEEIQDAIDSAIADMIINGVISSKIVETDPLIIRTVKTFCKAEFSQDDKESERYRTSYEMLRNHLSMSQDYAYFKITINTGIQCKVTFDNEVKETDDDGIVIFYTKSKNHVRYIVSGISYYTDVTSDNTVVV